MTDSNEIEAIGERWRSFSKRFLMSAIYYALVSCLMFFMFRDIIPVFAFLVGLAVIAYGSFVAWRTSEHYITLLERHDDKVHIAWYDKDQYKSATLNPGEVRARIEGSPYSTFQRYVLVLQFNGTTVKQYQGLQWKESDLLTMKAILSGTGASVRRGKE